MAIKQSRADLPPAPPKPARLPTRNPVIIDKFFAKWLEELLATGYDELALAIPDAGPYRASWASKRCDRALWYALNDVEVSNPLGVHDYWRFWLGTQVHQSIEPVMRNLGDGWIPEINVDLRPIGIPGSAHADLVRFVDRDGRPWEWMGDHAVVDDDGEPLLDRWGNQQRRYVYSADGDETQVELLEGEYKPEVMFATDVAEVKSVGGYSFKVVATNFKGPAEGPRFGAIVQGAMAAVALNAERFEVVNISLEPVGPDLAKTYSDSDVGRIAAEWHFDMPQMRKLVEREAERIRGLVDLGPDTLPAREFHEPDMPVGAVVVNPHSGMWHLVLDGNVAQAGKTWVCPSYCSHRDICIADGAGTKED